MGVQVQELTQNLMPWGKEYIDFSFAGRHISEFGLVVVTSGDRYQFAGSPEFEDETSNVNGVWGQYYWGTNFKTKTYTYSLATDGMTERQFEDFKYHFRPGHYGQFYEDSWFDRYCYVRIKTVIDFTFIPFQEEVEIAGVKFPSRVYKGECKIQFIQDKPFMHSFYQVLEFSLQERQKNQSKLNSLLNNQKNKKAELKQYKHQEEVLEKEISELETLTSQNKDKIRDFSTFFIAKYNKTFPFLVYDGNSVKYSRWAYLNFSYDSVSDRYYFEVIKIFGDSGQNYGQSLGEMQLNVLKESIIKEVNQLAKIQILDITECQDLILDSSSQFFILKLSPFFEQEKDLLSKITQRAENKATIYSLLEELKVISAEINTLTKIINNDNKEAAYRMMYHSNIPARDSWNKEIKCATGSWLSLPVIQQKVQTERDSQGNLINYWTEYVESSDNSNIYEQVSFFPYYNPSTFQTEADIEFVLKRSVSEININEWIPVYFNEIYDSNTNPKAPYNTIYTSKNISVDSGRIESNISYAKKYKYSLPEISFDINKAINVAWNFYQENKKGAVVELQERLQEELINSKVLVWAIRVLQKIQTNQELYYALDSEEKSYEGLLLKSDENYYPIEEALNNLDKISDSTYGEVIFYSGDDQEIPYEKEIEDYPGCFRTNKITVYPETITSESIEVDWFGYFNIMMLMMFANYKDNGQDDITSKGVFGEFYSYTLKFFGEKGSAFTSYKINYLNDDLQISQGEIFDENCSNIMLSSYLKLEGGDTINISTGKVATYHILGFTQGEDKPLSVEKVKLEYKYTYA